MVKLVLKVELYDNKVKTKAMKAVSGLSGVESVSVDMKDLKMTIIGEADPVTVVGKLRKLCHVEIVSVGPAKEEKKEEAKKEEKKGGEEKKKDPKEEMADLIKAYEQYYNQTRQPYPYHYYYRVVEEDPNSCVII
ncbi:hypothetical protein Ahy_B05g073901 isoform C [Arachis hypogaea]|uniref:HMA domain-containing protein n=1 Tax=Arachis hypogaea TaxID=3818 RepID=A0A444YXD2_ARAHY|nr:hypothetical protein Ahy_B05g073901 isoform C [Arachis hypogaea]